MSQQSAYSTVTLRRLPTGDTIQISLSYNRSLTILVNKTSRAEEPTLSENNYFLITPHVYATNGEAATLSNVKWYMDHDGYQQSDTPLAASDKYEMLDSGALKIKGSPIEGSTVKPFIITFRGKATYNGHTYDVEKSTMLDCMEVSESSYWGGISASEGTTLDSTNKSTVLTAKLYLGSSEVSASEYTVAWKKTQAGGDVDITDGATTKDAQGNDMWKCNGKQLTVYRDGVDSAAHFEAHFFKGDNEVEAEGVSIVDVADVLQLEVKGEMYYTDTATAVQTVRAYNSKTNETMEIKEMTVVVTDSVRQGTIAKELASSTMYTTNIADGTGTFSMPVANWKVPNEGTDKATNPWLICDVLQADGITVKDVPTNDKSKATNCDVIVLIGVTAELKAQ